MWSDVNFFTDANHQELDFHRAIKLCRKLNGVGGMMCVDFLCINLKFGIMGPNYRVYCTFLIETPPAFDALLLEKHERRTWKIYDGNKEL